MPDLAEDQPCVHDFWTQFWAVPAGDGRWRIMYAAREGMHYAEEVADGSHSVDEALDLLRRAGGTRGRR